MKLSISTSAFAGLYKNHAESLEVCSKSKFKHMDMSLSFVTENPDFLKEVDDILVNKEKYGITFTMGHAPFKYNPFMSQEHFDNQMIDIKNALKSASLLGIDRVTVHGGASFAESQEDLLNKNVEYFKQILEIAEKYNIIVMLENISSKIRNRPFDVETAEDILYVADKLNYHPLFKACWDSGHANTIGLGQYDNIIKLKDLIYGVHLQDNNGYSDDHMVPLLGTINFDETIQGLKDINYQGPFNFEIHVFNDGNTWPNFRQKYSENYKGEQLLFDPDDELRYLGIDLMYNVALYMAKKHNITLE